jgi:uncharacterized protein (TIGR03435 family)
MSTRLTAAAADCTAGLWTEVMVRTSFAVSFVMAPAIQPQVKAQAGPPPPGAQPTFEVASIRPNNSGENGLTFNYMAGRFTATNVTLRVLIRSAYAVQDSQIVGGPKWSNSDRFNIVAKGDVGRSSAPMVIQPDGPSRLQLMMQALLAERFKLVVHKEMRESNVFVLSVARTDGRLGPTLHLSDVDCAALAAQMRQTPQAAPPVLTRGNPCELLRSFGSLKLGGRPLSQLANTLSNLVGRPVVDETGLTGNFDVTLTWTPEQPVGDVAAVPADGPSIFSAIREQLGLKLVARKSSAEVLVVDSAEHPVEN